ncbi:MAG: DUF4405 domain-containing protein [Phycisphaeraceae bacterium]
MTRNSLNGLIDLALAGLMLGLLLTGLGMAYVLPAGTGHSATLWGLSRHGWGEVHLWMSYTVVVLVGLHLAVHWGWVLITARRGVWPAAKGCPSLGTKVVTGLGAAALVIVFVLSLGWWATESVIHNERGEGWRHEVGVVQTDAQDLHADNEQRPRRRAWGEGQRSR